MSLNQLANGNLLSGSDDETIGIWDMSSNTLIRQLNVQDGVFSLVLMDNGRVVSASSSEIIIWDFTTNPPSNLIKIPYTNYLSSIAYLPNNHFVGGDAYNQMTEWDTNGNVTTTKRGVIHDSASINLIYIPSLDSS
jgi:WD40 repeat protein